MELSLKNKTALVTASSNGIGLEIARSLAKEGKVFVNGRSATSVEAAIRSLESDVDREQLIPLVADNGTASGCAKTIEEVPDIDILVNNLGIYEAVGFFEEQDENWQHLFEVNIMSGVRLSRHYLKKMLEKGKGRLVFISSESGISPAPEMAHYSSAKTMQLGLSRALASLTKGSEVTVNSVLPGPTKTLSVEKFIQDVFPDLEPEQAQRRFMEENRPGSFNRSIDSAQRDW